jgi:hypothetical protein
MQERVNIFGEVHLYCPNNNEFTLCGYAIDIDPNHDETSDKADCEKCIAIVQYCKALSKTEYKQTHK